MKKKEKESSLTHSDKETINQLADALKLRQEAIDDIVAPPEKEYPEHEAVEKVVKALEFGPGPCFML